MFIFPVVAAPMRQSNEPTTLRFWHAYSSEHEAALLEIITTFNEEHEGVILVEPRRFSNSGLLYDQVILQLTGEQQLPNVVQVWPFEAALFDLTDSVLDVGDVLDSYPDEAYLLPPRTLSQDAVTSKVLGIPLHLYMHVLYANLDALAELGYAAVPQSFDEIADMACTFQSENGWSGGQFGVVSGMVGVTDGEFLQSIAAATDTPLWDGATFTIAPPIQSAIDKFTSMQTDGCLTISSEIASAIDTFSSGRSLFMIGSSSSLDTIELATLLNYATPFAWGAFPIPGDTYFVSAPLLTAFNTNTVENDAAKTFLAWLLRPENAMRWAELAGGVSINTRSLDVMERPSRQIRILDTIQNTNTVVMPVIAGYDVLRLEMQFALSRIFANPEETATQLQELETLLNQIWPAFYGLE